MKKIFFAVVALVGLNSGSSAQSESRFAQNYKVCRGETGYQVCPKEGTDMATNNGARAYIAIEKAPVWREISPCATPTSVNSIYKTRAGSGTEQRQTPVNGVQNEGLSENAHRNLNYGNNTRLSPNDGKVR